MSEQHDDKSMQFRGDRLLMGIADRAVANAGDISLALLYSRNRPLLQLLAERWLAPASVPEAGRPNARRK